MNELRFEIEQLEERIAPSCWGGNFLSGNETNIGGNNNAQVTVVGDNENNQNQGSGFALSL